MSSIAVAQAVGGYRDAFDRQSDLAQFQQPIDVLLFLADPQYDLDAKDGVLAALVTMRQQGEERQLALALLMLGLWPGLDGAFRRRVRRERIQRHEVVAAMYDHFAAQVDRMNFERVHRVAATLVRSTERDVAADLRRQRPEFHDELKEYEGKPCVPSNSLFDVPAGLDAAWELELLRDRIASVAEKDAELVLVVTAAGLTQAEAAESLGLTHEATRKRFQRVSRRLADWITEDAGSEAKPRPTKKSRAPSPREGGHPASSSCQGKSSSQTNALQVTGEPRRKPMAQDMWKQTEEMAKQHEQGASSWLKLQNDGDKAVVVFVGEPYPREVCFTEGRYVPFDESLRAQGHKPTLRIAFNVVLLSTQEVKVLEQGVNFFKDLVRVRDKYTLEKCAFEVQRHGAAKDPKTTYSILPDQQLTSEQMGAFNALQRHDLSTLYTTGPADQPDKAADGPIDPQLALSLAATLKTLPRQAVDQFCEKFSVQRIKDLRASQSEMAKVFVDALVTEFSPDAAVDPFA